MLFKDYADEHEAARAGKAAGSTPAKAKKPVAKPKAEAAAKQQPKAKSAPAPKPDKDKRGYAPTDYGKAKKDFAAAPHVENNSHNVFLTPRAVGLYRMCPVYQGLSGLGLARGKLRLSRHGRPQKRGPLCYRP